MHEMGLMQNAIETALNTAQELCASHVAQITLRVGEASGAVHEVLQMGFASMVQNTMAEGATLVIEPVPVTCYCHSCKIEFTPATVGDLYYECPQCHQFDTEIREGHDIYVGVLEMT